MFIWLASYPKSGNTLVRSMLTAYFFSEEGFYDFELLRNIKQFPKKKLFERMGIDIRNEKEVVRNYIKVQETINKKNSLQFLKTHSYLFNIDNSPFTDLNNSLGVIYIVRDPRNVVTSWANFADISIEESSDKLINGLKTGGQTDKDEIKTYINNWKTNYNSWKAFEFQHKYLLIKYEDLVKNTKVEFEKILKFVFKLKNQKFEINKKKFENVIKTTSFEIMKNLEKKKGFYESQKDKEGKKIPFFNLGSKNCWKRLLDPKIIIQIETAFKQEMIELGYL
tara:strand:- start:422 stop:1261 length:840 start_codon:yes stop_codon:yes gene_type:complete